MTVKNNNSILEDGRQMPGNSVGTHLPGAPSTDVEAVKQQLESVLQSLSAAAKDSLEVLKAFKEVLDARVTGYVTSNAKLQDGELLAAQVARQSGAIVPSTRVAKKLVTQQDSTLKNLLVLNEQNKQIAKEIATAKIEHAEVLNKGQPLLQKEELENYASKMNGILERVTNMKEQINNVVQDAVKDSQLEREKQLQIVESAYQSHIRPESQTAQALKELTVGIESMMRNLGEMNHGLKLGPQVNVAPAVDQVVENKSDVDETISRTNSGPA